MDNILDGLRENKKSLILVLALTILLIIISIINLILTKNGSNSNMEGIIESFAKIYYEDYYYPNVTSGYNEDYKVVLQNDSVNGIKLNLREIVNTFDVEPKNFYTDGNYCDFLKTYALIYPKSPYGKEDYEIKVITSCKKNV